MQGGIFAPNEARELEGLDSVEFGDEPRVQQQVVPLSAAGGNSRSAGPAHRRPHRQRSRSAAADAEKPRRPKGKAMIMSNGKSETSFAPPTALAADDLLEAGARRSAKCSAQERKQWQRERALIEAQAQGDDRKMRAEVATLRSDVLELVNAKLADIKDGERRRRWPAGPEGEKGAQGEPGLQGQAGEVGSAGPIGPAANAVKQAPLASPASPGLSDEPGPPATRRARRAWPARRRSRGERGEKGDTVSAASPAP